MLCFAPPTLPSHSTTTAAFSAAPGLALSGGEGGFGCPPDGTDRCVGDAVMDMEPMMRNGDDGERHGWPWDGFDINEVQLPDESDDYVIVSDVRAFECDRPPP